MKIKEIIKNLNEDLQGIRGPSGLNFPRGFSPQRAYGQMYQTGQQFSEPASNDFNISLQVTSINDHIQSILDRMKAGMSFKQALYAQANETNININDLIKILKKEL